MNISNFFAINHNGLVNGIILITKIFGIFLTSISIIGQKRVKYVETQIRSFISIKRILSIFIPFITNIWVYILGGLLICQILYFFFTIHYAREIVSFFNSLAINYPELNFVYEMWNWFNNFINQFPITNIIQEVYMPFPNEYIGYIFIYLFLIPIGNTLFQVISSFFSLFEDVDILLFKLISLVWKIVYLFIFIIINSPFLIIFTICILIGTFSFFSIFFILAFLTLIISLPYKVLDSFSQKTSLEGTLCLVGIIFTVIAECVDFFMKSLIINQ